VNHNADLVSLKDIQVGARRRQGVPPTVHQMATKTFASDCVTSLEVLHGSCLETGKGGGFVLMKFKDPVKVLLLDSGKQFIGSK